MFKTHFVVEEKANKEDKDVFIGDGFTFEKVGDGDTEQNDKVENPFTKAVDYPENENDEPIPF